MAEFSRLRGLDNEFEGRSPDCCVMAGPETTFSTRIVVIKTFDCVAEIEFKITGMMKTPELAPGAFKTNSPT